MEVPLCTKQSKSHFLFTKKKTNNNATIYYDLEHRKKDDFLMSSMAKNVVVIFEVQTLEMIIIIAHSITPSALPSNCKGC